MGESFSEMFATSKNKYHKQTVGVGSNHKSAQKLSRLSKLWIPIFRRLILTGVRTSNGIVQGSSDMQHALAAKWQDTFSEKTFEIGPAGTFVQAAQLPIIQFSIERPSVEDYEFFFMKLRVSACGPDGILYSGWRAADHEGTVTLHQYGEHLFFWGRSLLPHLITAALSLPSKVSYQKMPRLCSEQHTTRGRYP